MDILIKNATVITGDGATVIEEGIIWIENGIIADVQQGSDKIPHEAEFGKTIDAIGKVVFPGIINHHTHGCYTGPLFPSGAPPLLQEEALKNLDRHLQEGTTTLLNVCGFGTVEEGEEINRIHPINFEVGTAHTPSSIQAAEAVDGAGFQSVHRSTTVEQMLDAGAPAIGEIGAGMTLGGGGQDYRYIPAAIKAETGKTVDAPDAKRLKVAVLGRFLNPRSFDASEVKQVLDDTGLSGLLIVDRARELITNSVMPSVKLALQGFEEAAKLSSQTGVPVIFHHSTPSAATLIELARQYQGTKAKMVAGHANHNMFTPPEEAVRFSRELKDLGVIIDISTLDAVQTLWRNRPDNMDALLEADLVDTISTDFSGGHWDGITAAMQRIYRLGLLSLPEAIALGTGNVAAVFPLLAPDRGFVERGKIADLVIADAQNVARVETVVIGGTIAVRSGWCAY